MLFVDIWSSKKKANDRKMLGPHHTSHMESCAVVRGGFVASQKSEKYRHWTLNVSQVARTAENATAYHCFQQLCAACFVCFSAFISFCCVLFVCFLYFGSKINLNQFSFALSSSESHVLRVFLWLQFQFRRIFVSPHFRCWDRFLCQLKMHFLMAKYARICMDSIHSNAAVIKIAFTGVRKKQSAWLIHQKEREIHFISTDGWTSRATASLPYLLSADFLFQFVGRVGFCTSNCFKKCIASICQILTWYLELNITVIGECASRFCVGCWVIYTQINASKWNAFHRHLVDGVHSNNIYCTHEADCTLWLWIPYIFTTLLLWLATPF